MLGKLDGNGLLDGWSLGEIDGSIDSDGLVLGTNDGYTDFDGKYVGRSDDSTASDGKMLGCDEGGVDIDGNVLGWNDGYIDPDGKLLGRKDGRIDVEGEWLDDDGQYVGDDVGSSLREEGWVLGGINAGPGFPPFLRVGSCDGRAAFVGEFDGFSVSSSQSWSEGAPDGTSVGGSGAGGPGFPPSS